MAPLARVASVLVPLAMTIAACGDAPKPVSPVAAARASAAPAASDVPAARDVPAASASSSAAAAPPVTIEVLPPVPVVTVTPRKANGKLAKFSWGRGLCDNVGTYDTGRFTKAELAGTLQLVESNGFLILDPHTTRASLDRAFHETFERMRGLTIVPEPAWETYRATKLTQTQEWYQLDVSKIELRTVPARLRAHPAYPTCSRWADPLIDGSEAALLAGWRALARELGSKPGAGKGWSEVEARSTQPDAVAQARQDLVLFGWHNCVNALVSPLPFDETEFDKLFTKVKRDCEH